MVKKGDYVKIDTSKLKKSQSYHPNWEKLVKQMIKRGHGEVYVVNVHKDGKRAEIAESPMGALIGTATIPTDAIKENVNDSLKKIIREEILKELNPDYMNKRLGNDADSRYQKHLKRANDYLKEIAKKIKQHEREQKKEPNNWGYVGDMEHIADNLEEIKDFLK